MPHRKTPAAILFYLIFVAPLTAQSLVIKPYYGYLLPRLSEVNGGGEVEVYGWVATTRSSGLGGAFGASRDT